MFSFSDFSESSAPSGVTLAPLLAEEWEKLGNACAYAHIAKGGVSIDYFLNDSDGSTEYFFEKCKDFFTDSSNQFKDDDLSNKCFFWLQGESDANGTKEDYEAKLEILWDRLKKIGFTHFFCIRVDYFGSNGISG